MTDDHRRLRAALATLDAARHHSQPEIATRDAVDALVAVVREIVGGVGAKATDRTIFECRCCCATVWGRTDGSFDALGWGRADNIDGPNAICPECLTDPEAIAMLRRDWPEAAVRAAPEIEAAVAKPQAGDWENGPEPLGEPTVWRDYTSVDGAAGVTSTGWEAYAFRGELLGSGPETGPLGQTLADLCLCAHGFLAFDRISWASDRHYNATAPAGDARPWSEALTPETLPAVLAALREVRDV